MPRKTKRVVLVILPVRVTYPLRVCEMDDHAGVGAWTDSAVALDGPEEPMQAAAAGHPCSRASDGT
eukprot:gene22183-26748_t